MIAFVQAMQGLPPGFEALPAVLREGHSNSDQQPKTKSRPKNSKHGSSPSFMGRAGDGSPMHAVPRITGNWNLYLHQTGRRSTKGVPACIGNSNPQP